MLPANGVWSIKCSKVKTDNNLGLDHREVLIFVLTTPALLVLLKAYMDMLIRISGRTYRNRNTFINDAQLPFNAESHLMH